MNCLKCGFDNAVTHKYCCECGAPFWQVESEAERRSLTVMFCDLAGSTALSEQYDPEDLRQIIADYQDCCRAAISRYSGFIARYMGDGLLIYFGYPTAHEDDGQRAIRAALEIVETVPKLATKTGSKLAVRVGVATGDVVIGDNIGDGASEEVAVLGLTPNLAARLQSVAEENQIVVSDSTRQRLGEIVSMYDLGEFSLKGISIPVQAWRIGELTDNAPQSASLASFVGRESMFLKFEDALERVANGNIEILHITGQAGIGKTRLLNEFIVRNGNVNVEFWGCSAFHSNVPFHPLPENIAGLIESKTISGQSQRQFIFDVISKHLIEKAQNSPFMLCIEDAHWLDPTTIEYIAKLQERIKNAALLVVVASRPCDIANNLVDAMGGARLTLDALKESESLALVKSLLGGGMASKSYKKIVERGGGMPLFLEELANVVVNVDDGDIPDSLQESLLARLDGLGPLKRLAQLAAIFGRSFNLKELSFLVEKSMDDVANDIKRLKNNGLFIETTDGYSFRHALMQEVAYDTLLHSTRSRIHSEIADRLITEKGASHPELVARHLNRAKRYIEAIDYWCAAAQRSSEFWAHEEATAYYRDALEHAAAKSNEKWEFLTRLNYVDSLRIIDQYDLALEQLDLAEALAKNIDSDEDWLRFHVLRGNILFPLGKAEQCIISHEAALKFAMKLNYPEGEAQALSGIADAHFLSGRLASAENAYNACVTKADTNQLNSVVLSNISLRGHMRLYLCRIGDAEKDSRQAVRMAIEVGNRRAEMTARGSCLGKVLFETGALDEADEAFRIAGQLARDMGAHRFEALNLLFRGKVALEKGDHPTALTFGTRAVEIARESGQQFCLPMAIGVVACAQETPQLCRDALKEAEALIAAGCLAHNPLWFYRGAALTAISHGWADEARRYAQLLRDAFASEIVPWCMLMADGADALAEQLENRNDDAVLSVIERAKTFGFYGWANTLKRIGKIEY